MNEEKEKLVELEVDGVFYLVPEHYTAVENRPIDEWRDIVKHCERTDSDAGH